jgi:hypothetical protein
MPWGVDTRTHTACASSLCSCALIMPFTMLLLARSWNSGSLQECMHVRKLLHLPLATDKKGLLQASGRFVTGVFGAYEHRMGPMRPSLHNGQWHPRGARLWRCSALFALCMDVWGCMPAHFDQCAGSSEATMAATFSTPVTSIFTSRPRRKRAAKAGIHFNMTSTPRTPTSAEAGATVRRMFRSERLYI